MRRPTCALLWVVFACAIQPAGAQADPSASEKHMSASVGGTFSVFQPDFAGTFSPEPHSHPVAGASPFPLFGLGVYTDIRLYHWVQLELEGRRLRFDQHKHIYQDDYLWGARVPIGRVWRAGVYGKVLFGFSKMQYSGIPNNHGRVSDLAFGGSADIKLARRITLRAIDFEYQYCSARHFATLEPYGVTMGIAYRLF